MENQDAQTEGSVSMMAHKRLEAVKAEGNASWLREVDAKTTSLLEVIQTALAKSSGLKRVQQWGESIEKLQGEYKMPRFVIGVLGDTGSGKSSLINAVLDEERVVPTNCMRACTAVITEILWNPSDDPSKKYRAEIEFITQAEWTTEVIALHRDILDFNGKLSPDIRNADSDAGTAYAVLKAVYPTHTDEQLRDADPAVLANFAKVREVIGRQSIVEEGDCSAFYAKIQTFVDSEEKHSKNSTDTIETETRIQTMAFWPLIKVVRVFLKSEVVSTGVVLVDLPGGHDSNAARAAVAARYVKECSRLWIAAPITRAVDDKTAKTLMGNHFKQQLKYDGAYNNITFICTKADDMSLDEAAASLGIVDFIANEEGQKIRIETEISDKRTELETLEPEKSRLKEKYNNFSKDIDTWHGLHKQVSGGHRMFAPMESPRKRKRPQPKPADDPTTAKKVKKEPLSSDTESSSDESDLDADDSDADNYQSEPLTVEVTRRKLSELKEARKAVREEKRNVTRRIVQIKTSIKDLNNQRLAIKTNMYRVCIQGRNKYSRDAIKEDFAFGMKEFDEELLAEQQDGQPQTQIENTNYEQIGKDLPVFCISSRGYQKLRGRMKKDHRVVGFTSLDDTEIPGLRAHTLELAARIQTSHFRHHISEICRFLGFLDLFVAGDIANLKLSNKEKQEETQSLEKGLKRLGKELGSVVSRNMEDCRAIVKKHILKRTGKGVSKASEQASATAEGWGAKHDVGGLYYMTYKATCRRGGSFKGKTGLRDFNEDLLKPLKNYIAHSWDLAFNSQLPEKLTALAKSSKQIIDDFHDRMKDRRFLGENNELIHEIRVKLLAAQAENLARIATEHKKMIQDAQKDANRLFYPVVQGAMYKAYNDCVDQRGTGSFIIMKEIMKQHVEEMQQKMFKNAVKEVDAAINDMLKSLETTVRDDTNGVISAMHEDYIGLIGEVATETDNRVRQILSPVLREFYQKLLIGLTPTPEEAAAPEAINLEIAGEASDEDYQPNGDDSE